MEGLPRFLVIAGLALAAAGLILGALHGRLGWFGHLPGDVRIERPGFRFYFPITTLVLLNVVVSLILWIVARIRR